MKVSFSLPSKSKSKSRVRPTSDAAADEGNSKNFFTEFDPSDAKPNYVIPPLEDRRRIIHLPPLQSASGPQFEVEEIPSRDDHVSGKITYGLKLRQKVEEDSSASSKPEPVEQMLLKSMKKDLESLPDAPEFDVFESVPVDGFGAAILAGYGWKPGQGIGLKAKEDVQIVEFNKWNGTEGFGFKPDKVRVKGKESGRKIGDVELGLKGNNNVEKLVSGSHEIDNAENYRKKSRTGGARASKKDDREKALWLRSHIKVRVISKDVKGGRLYLKKAVVTDVVGPTTCDITMDETQELVQGVDQELLETALPRRGGSVLVLSGRHKGVYGRLVEKDLDKETGVVCDADTQEMLGVKLEQVAEYMGDPTDIGYEANFEFKKIRF